MGCTVRTAKLETADDTRHGVVNTIEQTKAIDFLIRDGRVVDNSGVEPVKSQLVRLVLRTELPFLHGIRLRDFSEITVNEFASYSAFRDYLRLELLELDDSLNDTQSDRELVKLGLRISDQVRAARSETEKARRKRAMAIGSVTATLAAVYDPALETALTALGVSGGVWGVIHAAADNSVHTLQEDKWHYVWALARHRSPG